ncbi:TLDc domain-containing protein [Entamoeba marina]
MSEEQNNFHFGDLTKMMKKMVDSLKEVGKEVNETEVEEVDKLLEKNDKELVEDIEEKELIVKYETFYDQLHKFVENKNREIVDVENSIKVLSGFAPDENFEKVLIKKKDNINKVINCVNRIVERIRDLETTIYNNRMKQLDEMKKPIFGDGDSQIKIIRGLYPIDIEMSFINDSIENLKQWSEMNTHQVIFDSKVDGDGYTNNVLCDRVYGRSKLYFITFDGNGNVFGGYVSVNIDKAYVGIQDNKSFLCSIVRNGQKSNGKYPIQPNYVNNAFTLCCNNPDAILYKFGSNFVVYKIGGNAQSICNSNEFSGNQFVNNNNYKAQRLIVLQMKQVN